MPLEHSAYSDLIRICSLTMLSASLGACGVARPGSLDGPNATGFEGTTSESEESATESEEPTAEPEESTTGDSSQTAGDESFACPPTYDELSALDGDGFQPDPFASCELQVPCSGVIYNNMVGESPDHQDTVDGPEALACVLTALDAGTPGEYFFNAEGGDFGIFINVRVYEGGQLEWSRSDWSSDGYSEYRAPALLDTNYDYSQCRIHSAWSGAWNCVREGFAVCESWADEADLCPS